MISWYQVDMGSSPGRLSCSGGESLAKSYELHLAASLVEKGSKVKVDTTLYGGI